MRRAIVLLVCLALVAVSAREAAQGGVEEQEGYIPSVMALPPSYMGDFNPHMNMNSELTKNFLPALIAQKIKKKVQDKKSAKKVVEEKKQKLPMAFDVADLKNLPTDKQLPGDVVRLAYAPGALPDLSEEVLPQELLPPPDCPDEDARNDVKLWNLLTSKISGTKASVVKYKKWLKGADLAIKKVRKQISLTKKNKALIDNAIKAMGKQRREIVKRLKTKKLTRDLEQAETKMKQLQEYGAKLGATKMSLVQGNTQMKRRVGVLADGIKQLRSYGVDPEDD